MLRVITEYLKADEDYHLVQTSRFTWQMRVNLFEWIGDKKDEEAI